MNNMIYRTKLGMLYICQNLSTGTLPAARTTYCATHTHVVGRGNPAVPLNRPTK